jgi:hypothetical protein
VGLGLGWGSLVAVLLGSVAFALVFLWDGLYPLITVPLAVGAFVGLMARRPLESLITGVAVGFLGSVGACLMYSYDGYAAYLQKTNPVATADILATWWARFVVPLLAANPVNDRLLNPAIIVVVGSALTMGFSMAASVVATLVRAENRRWLGLAVIGMLGVCLAFTMFSSGSAFIRMISNDPPAKTYGFDAIINLKTYYLMRGGMNYYDAILKAAEGDLRINDIKGGKWGQDWGIVSPTHIRQPEVFYLWTAVGFFGASGIVWAAVLLAIGLWATWYWALFPRLGQRALAVAFGLYPLLTVQIGSFNLFHPDWWATMMLMLGAAFLVRKRFTAAAVFALLAVIFREVLIFYLLVLIATGVVFWLRRKVSTREVAGFAIGLVVFAVAYAAHYFAEAPYIVLKSHKSTLDTILAFARLPMSAKFLGPTSYLMFPYGDAVVPAFLLVIVGAVGFLLVLRGSDFARWALPSYLFVFLAFLALIGASSTYWGQDVTTLGVTGCAVLLAGLDTIGHAGHGRALPAEAD